MKEVIKMLHMRLMYKEVWISMQPYGKMSFPAIFAFASDEVEFVNVPYDSYKQYISMSILYLFVAWCSLHVTLLQAIVKKRLDKIRHFRQMTLYFSSLFFVLISILEWSSLKKRNGSFYYISHRGCVMVLKEWDHEEFSSISDVKIFFPNTKSDLFWLL